ncbi:hypothetical protein FSP39_016029 [Pinctada imbricata]|uniref:Laminin G domain-containing protein n=1 Tax=Pinctada imbricata TaxID=66713 RepID=A0AA89C5J0_PINIB|nr:hypothetical protein FSP39_016029 [Pinctada imbricata]
MSNMKSCEVQSKERRSVPTLIQERNISMCTAHWAHCDNSLKTSEQNLHRINIKLKDEKHKHNKGHRGHNRRRGKGRRRNRRVRYHKETLSASPGRASKHLQLPQSDDGRRPWRNNYWRDRSRVPAAAARLEQRLNPSVAGSLQKLKQTLTQILQKMGRYIGEIKTEYKDVQNGSKHDIMEIRKILQQIADENDEAYEVILDVSQLLRYIMLRAHQHGMVAPAMAVQAPPVMPNVSFDGQLRSVLRTKQIADATLTKAKDYKMRLGRMDAKVMATQQHDQPKVPEDALADLQRLSRKVLQSLGGKMITSVTKMKLERYKNFDNTIMDNMRNATLLSRTAYQDIKYTQRMFQDNKEYHSKIKEAQRGKKDNPDRARQKRSSDSENLTYDYLQDLTQKAYMKARNFQKTASIANRTLLPLLSKAEKLPKTRGQSSLMVEIRAIVTRVQSLTMKLDRKLDEMRIFLGVDDILKERCEQLVDVEGSGGIDDLDTIIDCEKFGIGRLYVEGSGDIDDLDTIIDCEKFGILPVASGSGDEDLLPVSIRPTLKITSTPPPLTSTTPSVDVIEGSGDGEFEFEDKDKPKKDEDNGWFGGLFGDDPGVIKQSLFGIKLKENASKEREESEELYKRAQPMPVKIEVFTKKFNGLISIRDGLENFVDMALNVTSSWQQEKASIDNIKERIAKFDKSFYLKLEMAENKSKEARAAANARLEEYREASKNKQSESSAADTEVLTKLISAVDKVKKNTEELKRLKDRIPDPCKTLELTAINLRTNIAELRAKIQKAKQITRSLPLSVSFDGNSRLQTILDGDMRLKSPTTSLGMCIKVTPSDKENYHIATFASNTSLNYDISLVKSAVRVSVIDSDGDEAGVLTSQTPLTPDSWYKLQLQRFGNTLKLTTDSLSTDDDPVTEAKALTDVPPIHTSPQTAYLGANLKGDSYFNGCIGQVSVNGRHVGLLNTAKTGSKLSVCTTNCQEDRNQAIVFEGDGYTKYGIETLRSPSRIENIQLGFRSQQKNGLMFLLNDRLQDLQVLVSLVNGAIYVEGRTKRGTTMKKSSLSSYSDGKIHKLEIQFEADGIMVRVDNGSDQFLPERATQEISKAIDDGIFLGGLGVKSQLVTGKSKLRPFSGCITDFKIGDQSFPFYLAKETKNAFLGDCMQNIWMKCVRFQDDSSPIVLEKTDNMKFINLVVSRDSVGRVLHYKNGEKFNIELRVDGNGIEIFDVREDETYKMVSPGSPADIWYSIQIQDKPDEVIFTLNGTTQNVEYTSGGGWFGGETKKDDYSLTVGGGDQDDASFTGSVAALVVNDKEINLRQNSSALGLSHCEKPAMNMMEPKEKDEKLQICSRMMEN